MFLSDGAEKVLLIIRGEGLAKKHVELSGPAESKPGRTSRFSHIQKSAECWEKRRSKPLNWKTRARGKGVRFSARPFFP